MTKDSCILFAGAGITFFEGPRMSRLPLLLIAVAFAGLFSWLVVWIKRARDRAQLEAHSISAEALYAMLQSGAGVRIYDVRQPLDLLANSEVIPGAVRIPPKDVMANPSLIPREGDSIVYCTCPSDKTSKAISDRARAEKFFRVKFLRGGLAAWKAKGYPVEVYETPFHLDTGS
jgi:rhodanese-related sulfurtransferase